MMFRESVSHYCPCCESESKWQTKQSLAKEPYFCRACFDGILAESGKSQPIVGDPWLDEWYRKEKERMKNERTKNSLRSKDPS